MIMIKCYESFNHILIKIGELVSYLVLIKGNNNLSNLNITFFFHK